MSSAVVAPDDAGRKRRNAVLVWMLKIGLLGLLLALIARDFDTARFVRAFQSLGVAPFVICFGIEQVAYLVETLRLLVLCSASYPYGLLLRTRYLAALIGVGLPGLAASDVVRMFLIDRERPGNKTGILVLLLGNRLYGVLSLAALGIVALLQPTAARLPQRLQGPWPIALLAAVMIAPLCLRWRAIQRLCEALLRHLPTALSRIGARVLEATLSLTRVRQWGFAIFTSTLTSLLTVSDFWVLGRAAGTGVSFGDWCLLVPFVSVATILPLGLGAIGTQEAALFAAARILGIHYEPLLLVSVGMHLVRISGTFPGFAFFDDLVLTIQQFRAGKSA